jgi:hypothetical protein
MPHNLSMKMTGLIGSAEIIRLQYCDVCDKRILDNETKSKLRGLSPRANYTDQSTAACLRSWCQFLWIEGVVWSANRIPTARILGFLDWRRCYFFQVAPQL